MDKMIEGIKLDSNKDLPKKVQQFLLELGTLSKEYDLYIGGCGDCGSPWLVPMIGNYVEGYELGHLTYSEKAEEYYFQNIRRHKQDD